MSVFHPVYVAQWNECLNIKFYLTISGKGELLATNRFIGKQVSLNCETSFYREQQNFASYKNQIKTLISFS